MTVGPRPRRFLALLAALAFAAGAAPARAADPKDATFTHRGVGDEYEIVLKKLVDGKVRYYGLMKNRETVVFTGEVTHMTDDWAFVHFFRNAEGVFGVLNTGRVLPIPGISPAPGTDFEVFEISRAEEKAVGGGSPFWRGIRVRDAEGKRREVWLNSLGELYYPPAGGGPVGGELVKDAKPFRFPFVTLGDFRSWHAEKPAVAAEAKSYYTIFATAPDSNHGLVFDLMQVRPEPANYVAVSESRGLGRSKALRSAAFLASAPQWFLSTVYHEFQNQPDRPAFDEKLMVQIRKEDRTLGFDRLVYVWATDEHSRIPGGLRLFQGYASDQFHSKDVRLPVERQYAHLDLRGRFPGEALYEFNRLTVRKELAPWLSTKRMVNLMLEYMAAHELPDGPFILHTDADGAILYRRFFGAKVEFGPELTGDGTIILSVDRATLAKRVETDELPGLARANLRSPLPWCAWTLK